MAGVSTASSGSLSFFVVGFSVFCWWRSLLLLLLLGYVVLSCLSAFAFSIFVRPSVRDELVLVGNYVDNNHQRCHPRTLNPTVRTYRNLRGCYRELAQKPGSDSRMPAAALLIKKSFLPG